jgi:hypothetical protein
MTTSEYALAVRAPRAARSSHPGRRTSRGFIRSGAGRFLHCLFYRGRTHQSRPEHRAFFIAKGRGAFGTRLGTIRGLMRHPIMQDSAGQFREEPVFSAGTH